MAKELGADAWKSEEQLLEVVESRALPSVSS
jgi:hypothetical protein